MKRNFSLIAALAFVILGGCGLNEPLNTKQVQGENNKPQPAALKDDYTKGYLTSAKEVETGYFEFKSKTNGYTMLFPKDAVISDNFGNEKHDNEYESILYGAEVDGAGIDTQITYENNSNTKKINPNLSLLSSSIDYKGTFKEAKEDGKVKYFAKETIHIEKAVTYSYLSFIKADKSNQAVRIVYTVTCQKDNKTCMSKENTFEQDAIRIMKSVSFNQE
ncbi:hypothetical protein J9317_18075 [Metabacillus sp. KIGAM252]|uniref:Lipoprotein YvcA n=1 Tax=Metabacillus flavus TaxID=2823519 RepID=A0ABS5LIT2_9BACI|nr:hypothetical protein [Metabacillus flavus]MBS2970655.1 hypothetical protein [Metabacillus flavus]